MSKELIKYDPIVQADEALSAADFCLIYNSHGSGEAAYETARAIKPNSLVFIEGCGGDISMPELVDRVGSARVQYGRESKTYQDFKKLVYDIYAQQSTVPDSSPNDYTQHASVLAMELISKDCIVITADHFDSWGDGDEKDAESKRNHHITKLVDLVQGGGQDYDGLLSSGIYRRYISDTKDVVLANEIREKEAVAMIIGSIAAYYQDPHASTTLMEMKDQDIDKIPTYVVYGSAHARSLTQRLSSKGVRFPKIAELGKSRVYIPLSQEEIMTTINSDLATKFFSIIAPHSTMYYLTPKEDMEEVIQQLENDFRQFDGQAFGEDNEFTRFFNNASEIYAKLRQVEELDDDQQQALQYHVDSFVRLYGPI